MKPNVQIGAVKAHGGKRSSWLTMSASFVVNIPILSLGGACSSFTLMCTFLTSDTLQSERVVKVNVYKIEIH